MVNRNFFTLATLAVLSSLMLAGCSVSPEAPDGGSGVSMSGYGPQTFDPDYVDETENINALDAPVAESLDEVRDDQYVMVTASNGVLAGRGDYQLLYEGDDVSTVLMVKGEALKLAQGDGGVVVEPNSRVTLFEEDASVQATQSGAGLNQWGIDRIDQQSLPLDDSYTYKTDGAGVTVYVVDTGVRTTHTEFTGRIPNGFDAMGDGNGYEDCHGHGTHVAGTVGGTQYGVAKNVTIVPVRVFGCAGETSGASVTNGLNWVKANHSGGPAVINLSLGSDAVDAGWKTIVDDLTNSGFIVVAAAGNGGDDAIGDDACATSPAYVPNAITVGATTITDGLAYFSNHGSCVDILAPGYTITSAIHTNNTGSTSKSGTSMATPHVAGAVARILQVNPSYTAAQVDSVLASTSSKNKITSVPAGTPNELLYMDGQAAVQMTVTPVEKTPSAPTVVAVKTIKVNSMPEVHVYAKHSGTGVASYSLYVAETGQTTPVKTVTLNNVDPTQPLDLTVSGLTVNKTYDVWMNATNSVGTSVNSIKDTFTVVM